MFKYFSFGTFLTTLGIVSVAWVLKSHVWIDKLIILSFMFRHSLYNPPNTFNLPNSPSFQRGLGKL